MNSDQGERLVFLVSQPRSGSTLLQRILGAHPEVDTCSETWLLLRPLWGISSNTAPGGAPYDAVTAQQGLKEFLARLPAGTAEYYRGCALMYSHLYERALQASGRRLYLDKTPRYYGILREIAAVFPQARFILLARHPLAVMDSILRTFLGGDWSRLNEHREDLLDAPRALHEAREFLGKRAWFVNYEPLVTDPHETVQGICEFLGVNYLEAMISDYGEEVRNWALGDRIGVYQHKGIDDKSRDTWTRALSDPQFRIAARGYLDALGDDLLAALGYEPKATRDELRRRSGTGLGSLVCVSWRTLIYPVADGPGGIVWRQTRPRLAGRLARRGKVVRTQTAQQIRTALKRLRIL